MLQYLVYSKNSERIIKIFTAKNTIKIGDIMNVEGFNIEGLLVILFIGAVAGWIAGTIMRGGGFGIIGNMLVGIVGSLVGGYVIGFLGISIGSGILGSLITATIGAVVLLFIVGLIRKI